MKHRMRTTRREMATTAMALRSGHFVTTADVAIGNSTRLA
jgi:hypothetical protein